MNWADHYVNSSLLLRTFVLQKPLVSSCDAHDLYLLTDSLDEDTAYVLRSGFDANCVGHSAPVHRVYLLLTLSQN
jgi:hypothetical protein